MHRRRILNWFSATFVANWPTKLLSLIVAAILWFHVLSVEDPQTTQTLTVKVVAVNEPSDLKAIKLTPEAVELRLRGRESALAQAQTGRIRTEANLRGTKVGENEVPLRVAGVPLSLAVVPGYPSTATAEMDTIIERQRPVNDMVRGDPARGFVIEDVTVEPAEVTVRGATSAVREVARTVAIVDVSGINQSAPFEVETEARDNRNVAVSGVDIDPPVVTVTVKMRELNVKYVPVRPVLGDPPSGYRVAAVRTDPEIVTITSEGNLSRLRTVATLLVDISGLRGSKSYSVSLNVPAAMRVEGPAAVQVTVTTQPVGAGYTVPEEPSGDEPAAGQDEPSDGEEDNATSLENESGEPDSGEDTDQDGTEPDGGADEGAQPADEQDNRATTPPQGNGGGT